MANSTKSAARRARSARVKRSEIDRLSQENQRLTDELAAARETIAQAADIGNSLIAEVAAVRAAAERDTDTIRLLTAQVNHQVLSEPIHGTLEETTDEPISMAAAGLPVGLLPGVQP